MKKIFSIQTLVALALVTLFCDFRCTKNEVDCHMSFWIYNNTGKSIYFTYNYDTAVNKLNYPPGITPETNKCEANKSQRYNATSCHEDNINRYGNLSVFFFDADIIENTSWEIIKQNRLFLKRIDLTIAELNSSSWNIAYP